MTQANFIQVGKFNPHDCDCTWQATATSCPECGGWRIASGSSVWSDVEKRHIRQSNTRCLDCGYSEAEDENGVILTYEPPAPVGGLQVVSIKTE